MMKKQIYNWLSRTVARMKRGGIRGSPDSAALHPGCTLAILSVLWLAGCATAPVVIAPPLSEAYPQLPKPDTALNIPGLGPCDDNPDRTLHLNSQQPVTILAHGCFGSAGRFRTLAEVLAFHGQQSACFSYDDRDSLMRSSRQLADALEALAARSTAAITVIGHSQGGLVARKALVSERDDPIASPVPLHLVSISAPFAGIHAARYCAIPWLRIGTLGIHDFLCWMVSGDKWYEITAASNFIQQPGALVPAVERHLLVATDENGTCRRYDEAGACVEDDFVFSLAEQVLPPVSAGALATAVEVPAGHVEIVGESGIKPEKLIRVLQQEGYIRTTEPTRTAQFQALLQRLYGHVH